MRNIQATKGKCYGLAVLVAACSLLLLPGCRNLLEPQGRTGTLSLTINSQSVERTIRPDITLNDFYRFELELFHHNTGNRIDKNWTDRFADTIELAAGTWELHVAAFMPSGLAAEGSLYGIVVPSGGTVSGNVKLAPIAWDGTGTFSWDVSFAEDIRVARMEIHGIERYNEWRWGSLYLIDYWWGNAIIDNPGSLDLDAGQYQQFKVSNKFTRLREWAGEYTRN